MKNNNLSVVEELVKNVTDSSQIQDVLGFIKSCDLSKEDIATIIKNIPNMFPALRDELNNLYDLEKIREANNNKVFESYMNNLGNIANNPNLPPEERASARSDMKEAMKMSKDHTEKENNNSRGFKYALYALGGTIVLGIISIAMNKNNNNNDTKNIKQ